ncbi:hypothetical protein K6Q96_08980 [Grimontia kaedaensis]|uniref:Uncharacterized protein n=1 Tax=Grimontia kaedaensis TaxID=2872157 RepID=A0ABY4WNC3_9GAMM|nr:hypothetical protein [Grimontia kaedaensis]USH01074.1 hypothetical protein K6Q96_08980 [Grimontia kaedaensis]
MEFETILKLLGVGAAMIGVGWKYYQFTTSKKSNLREEYRFAKQFLSDCEEGNIHPFAEEKGYQAIAGSAAMQLSEIKYILSLKDPVSKLNQYIESRNHFESFNADNPSLKLKWLYRNTRVRSILIGGGFIAYLLSAISLVSPLLFPEFWFGSEDVRWSAFLVLGPILGPAAFLSMRYSVKTLIAGRLVENQKSHRFNFALL